MKKKCKHFCCLGIQTLLFLCYFTTLKFPNACLASSDKLDFLCSCLAFSFRFTTSLEQNSYLESVDLSGLKKFNTEKYFKNSTFIHIT